jgi:hypothetical protein
VSWAALVAHTASAGEAFLNAEELLVLLAREAGFLKTAVACRRLNVSATQLLILRRKALEEALEVMRLPPVAVKGQMLLPFSEDMP